MNWTRNAIEGVAAILALLLAFWLQGCTTMLPQSQLQPEVQKHLGRALTLEEVDIRESIDGAGIYAACLKLGVNPMLIVWGFPTLEGCAFRWCGEDKPWASEKPCVCEIRLVADWERVRSHETKHCYGWGEL